MIRIDKTLENGEVTEILPVDGGYFAPSYSTVEQSVRHAQSKGVDSNLWPIYYDPPSTLETLSVDTVFCQCAALKSALEKLSPLDIADDWLLNQVFEWLNAGERFCILE